MVSEEKLALALARKAKKEANVKLRRAAKADDAAGVREALAQGADPNHRDNDGFKPLMLAVWKKSAKAFEELLPVTELNNAPGERGLNAFMVMLRFGVFFGQRELFALETRLSDADKKGTSALMHAAWKGQDPDFEALAARALPGDLEQRDDAGSTVVHYAVAQDSQKRLARLLDMGADGRKANAAGMTPYLAAVSANAYNCLQMLQSRGLAARSDRDAQGNTDVMLALRGDYQPLIRRVMDAQGEWDPQARNAEGLGLLAFAGNLEAAERIIARQARMEAQDWAYLEKRRQSEAMDPALLGLLSSHWEKCCLEKSADQGRALSKKGPGL